MSFFNHYDDKKTDAKTSSDIHALKNAIKTWSTAKTPDRKKLEKEISELKSQISQYDEKSFRITRDKYIHNLNLEIEKLNQQIEAKMSRIMDKVKFETYLSEHFVKPEEFENKRKQFEKAITRLKAQKSTLEKELSHADMNVKREQAKVLLTLNNRLKDVSKALAEPDIKTILPIINLYSDLVEDLEQQQEKIGKYKIYLQNEMLKLIKENPDAQKFISTKKPIPNKGAIFNNPHLFSSLNASEANKQMADSFKKAANKFAMINLLIVDLALLKNNLNPKEFINEYLNLDKAFTQTGVTNWIEERLSEFDTGLTQVSDYIVDPKNEVIKTLSERRGSYKAKGETVAEDVTDFIKKSQAFLKNAKINEPKKNRNLP